MRSGLLKDRVTIKNYTETTFDEYGQRTYSTTTEREVWAYVRPLSGREYLLAAQTVAGVDALITIRYTTQFSVTPKSFVVHGASTYDVQSVIDVDNRHTELQLVCVRSAT